MTYTTLTELAPSRVAHLPLARVARLIRSVLALGLWPIRALGRALAATVSLAGQSASMAYVDPFSQSKSNASRRDHPEQRY